MAFLIFQAFSLLMKYILLCPCNFLCLLSEFGNPPLLLRLSPLWNSDENLSMNKYFHHLQLLIKEYENFPSALSTEKLIFCQLQSLTNHLLSFFQFRHSVFHYLYFLSEEYNLQCPTVFFQF